MTETRPNYGIDAPIIVRRLAVLGAAGVAAAVILRATGFGTFSLVVGAVGTWSIACAVVMVAGSKVGKVRLRDTLVSQIASRGDERVLDFGCGMGCFSWPRRNDCPPVARSGSTFGARPTRRTTGPRRPRRTPDSKGLPIASKFETVMRASSTSRMKPSTSSCRALRSTTFLIAVKGNRLFVRSFEC